jgi:FkbM family methyltransferase
MNLKKWFIHSISQTIRKHHRNAVITGVAQLCNKYLFYYWNEMHWETHSNGEALLLRTLAEYWRNNPSVTVFDVGANTGTYSRLVRQHLPDSRIHCFEIVPATRETLIMNVATLGNITISNRGLSDADTLLDITFGQANDTMARAVSSLAIDCKSVLSLPVQTGDSYMFEQNIPVIDLLKIDTEGHEMAVLEGCKGAIAAGKIRVIQFEYGTTWIPSFRFLHEAYALLEPAGFHIGRLFPDGVFFKPYHRREDDHFRMGNYVAVHESCLPIIQALNINPVNKSVRLAVYG